MSRYKPTPTQQEYYDRVGAEVINFRRGLIKDYHGVYYKERAVIRFTKDGEISVSSWNGSKDFDPTEEERAKILEEWKDIKLPLSIQAESMNGLVDRIDKTSSLYPLIDRRSGNILMVQERRETPDGKSYHPWTMFDDGEWYNMEPDGKLPFWKPLVRRNKNRKVRIMVHEGCKGAQYLDDLFNNPLMAEQRAKHPWADFLSKYEHWGQIGGAMSPQRADYDELRAEKAVEVIYVCDNDRPGFDAVKVVSRYYRKKMRVARFDQSFPPSWDLADEFPEKMYNKQGQWIGKQFEEYLDTATWATKLVPNPSGEGRPVIMINQDHKEEVVHCITPEVVVFLDNPDKQLTPAEYNNKIAPFSDTNSTYKYLIKDDVGKGAVLTYEPGLKPGLYSSSDGVGRSVNTHVGTTVRRVKGDPKPFIAFMEHLFPEESDRHHMMRWAATLIARPDIRMLQAVLLISEAQGVGKTTLGDILGNLVGANNVSFPNEDDITNSQYTYWLAHKRLAVCNEIYAGASVKPYNRLKSIITDQDVNIKKKYLADYKMRNTIHIFACSNSMRALHMVSDDRRWFIPTVTEMVQPREFWDEFHSWLKHCNGLEIIHEWAYEFLKVNQPITKSEIAPNSTKKQELVNESLSPGLMIVDGFLRFVQEYQKELGVERYIIKDSDLVDIIRTELYDGKRHDRLEKPLTIRKYAKALGFYINKDRAFIGPWGCHGTGPRLICSHNNDAQKKPHDLLAEGMMPLDIQRLYKDKMPMARDMICFGGNGVKDGKVVALRNHDHERK